MAKRSLLIFIITISFIALVSCDKLKNNNTSCESERCETIFTLWIYPIGTSSETYQISLLENKILQVKMGDRGFNDLIDPNKLESIEKKNDVELSDENYQKTTQMADDIYMKEDIKTDSTTVADAWIVKFSYKDKDIVQPCYENTSPELEAFYNFLIGLSPIKIDMRGFA